MYITIRLVLVLLILSISSPTLAQQPSLSAVLDRLVQDGRLVAAQAVVGRGEEPTIDHFVGRTSPDGDRAVDAETLFCIGSCSKPVASAIVMSLIHDGLLQLEHPIDQLLPPFGEVNLENGERAVRAPTIKELLAHRSGIYSQKRGMTDRQASWIRDFRLTLEQSVDGIAMEPLFTQPGSEFAYSGAGYCVLGRVAEVATETTFEELLQTRLGASLGFARTTYFPDRDDDNVAAGGARGAGNPSTPHLTEPELRLPLIGGSLYSTARETAKFLCMTAHGGEYKDKEVLSAEIWETWTSHAYSDEPYGYGWAIRPAGPVDDHVMLTHTGALASSRSSIIVIPYLDAYAVVHYTVVGNDRTIGAQIKRAMMGELSRLR